VDNGTLLSIPKPRPDLRERAARDGLHNLGDGELLSLVLGTGSEGQSAGALSEALLLELGGLPGIARLGTHELSRFRGIGLAKAMRVVAALELGKRATIRMSDEQRTQITCCDDVARWARPRLAALDHEEMWLLCLDGQNGLKATRRVALGGAHGCALTVRDILAPAMRDAASAIVLVHNHPSGDPRPSSEDVEMTRELLRACELLGLPLFDHVVVARAGARSIRDALER
jgi:DNA repair protein RadC